MNTSAQSETLLVVSMDTSVDALTQAAKVASTYLEATQQAQKNNAFKVFAELAVQTFARASLGKTTVFSAENLKQGVSPHASKDASGWISDLWRKLLGEEAQWQEGLRDVARELGYSYIPKLRKEPGSPAGYFLEAILLVDAAAKTSSVPVPSGGVRYIPQAVIPPAAWLSSALRSGVVPWSGGIRWGMFAVVMLSVISVLLGGWLLLYLGIRSPRPVNASDVVVAAMVGAGAYFVREFFVFVEELFDLRIVLAPVFLAPLKQDNVTLEFRHVDGDMTRSELAFVHYSAICPQCGGSISIYRGRDAFPDRLVGRCRRSAREHIFSFDPVLKVGRPLH